MNNQMNNQKINKITKARRLIAYLNGILWSKKKKEIYIYETMVKSVIIYHCEAWGLIERSKKALKATKINAIRRSMRIL